GIRTPLGIKVLGGDLKVIQGISENVEAVLKRLPETRSVYAERSADGYYLDFEFDREALARYGISIDQANMVVNSAIGGENVSYTVEGRERYPINVRYEREFRDDVEKLKRVLIPAAGGAGIPLVQIAQIRMTEGPAMIRNENGLLAGYVYIDTAASDLGGYIARAKEALQAAVSVPPGYSMVWSGQYENMQRVKERLWVVIPATLFLIVMLLYLNTGSFIKTSIVLLAVPFSLVGSVWLLYLLGYNLSIAVWVGMIALMGLDAETGVFMLLYLDLAIQEQRRAGRLNSVTELKEAVIHGAVKRMRPKMMTVLAAFMGLLPIMFYSSAGSDVMKRIAAPMIGGLLTSFILELLVYPVLYFEWHKRQLPDSRDNLTHSGLAAPNIGR
ncbi:MAG: efflux RND transporter permease subunit, partial [Oligoflexia bacterium]|nr:efflux RND transporter permease subunit [Oligoflexia bacterium]